ncbi:MAG: hypothetical protein HY762_02985 [Planctomycetes bacterium]|nr:hypothetical protein [Planctomycetota bacterium]
MKTRTILIFLAIFACLLLLVVINFKIVSHSFVSPARAETLINQITGLEVKVSKVEFNFWRGIKITGLQLPQGDLLKIRRIIIIPNRMKLIRGELVIDEVIIDRPDINYLAEKLPQLKISAGASKTAAPRIMIRDGRFAFSHPDLLASGATETIDDIDLYLYPLSAQRYLVEGRAAGLEGAHKEKVEWRINGELDAARQFLKIALASDNINVGESFAQRLAEHYRHIWQQYQPSGPVNLELNLAGSLAPGNQMDFNINVNLLGNEITYRHFPYRLQGVIGQIVLTRNGIRLVNMRSRMEQLSVALESQIMGYARNSPYEIRLNVTNMPLDKRLYNALSPDLRATWDKLKPSAGSGNAEVLVNYQPSTGIEYQLQIFCKNATFTPLYFLYRIIDAEGEIEARIATGQPTNIKIKSISGRHQSSAVTVSGNITAPPDLPAEASAQAGNTAYDLTINGKDVDAADMTLKDAMAALTGDADKFWAEQKPSGKIDCTVKLTGQTAVSPVTPCRYDVALMRDQSGRAEYTDYLTDIKFNNCRLKAGLEFTEINGNLRLKGRQTPKPSAVKMLGDSITATDYATGSLKLNQVKVDGKRINNLSVNFIRQDYQLKIYDIKGSAYNGNISGYLMARLKDKNGANGEYSGQINLSGVDIREFSRDTSMTSQDISGKFSADVTFSGQELTWDSLNAHGRAFITDAHLWDVPIFLSIFDTFKFGKKTTFKEGEIRFQARNGKINFHRMIFSSPSLTLKGAGPMKLADGALDLQFDAYVDIALLPNILDTIKNFFTSNIYTVKVRGTFWKPVTKFELLPVLDIFKADEKNK